MPYFQPLFEGRRVMTAADLIAGYETYTNAEECAAGRPVSVGEPTTTVITTSPHTILTTPTP
jgi:hypothetical protein